MKREEERIGRELAAREMVEAVALIEASKKKGKGIKLKEGEKLDKDALMREALTGQIKERAELEKKLAGLAKRMDHFERAKREEESPHILAAHGVGLQASHLSNDSPSPPPSSKRTHPNSACTLSSKICSGSILKALKAKIMSTQTRGAV